MSTENNAATNPTPPASSSPLLPINITAGTDFAGISIFGGGAAAAVPDGGLGPGTGANYAINTGPFLPEPFPEDVARLVRRTHPLMQIFPPPLELPGVPRWPAWLFKENGVYTRNLDYVQEAYSLLWLLVERQSHWDFRTIDVLLPLWLIHTMATGVLLNRDRGLPPPPALTRTGRAVIIACQEVASGRPDYHVEHAREAAHDWIQTNIIYLPESERDGIGLAQLWWMSLQTSSYLSGYYTQPTAQFINALRHACHIYVPASPPTKPAETGQRRRLS